MCFDVKTRLESQLRRAKHKNDAAWIKELETLLQPYVQGDLFHVSGFEHPNLLIYTNKKPYEPVPAVWGLIPAWVKNEEQKTKTWNNTINARGETMFEKPSFRQPAQSKRCLIPIDGFYEHHHANGKTYPFFIRKKNNEPMHLAGLWDEWRDPASGKTIQSTTIVTTKANSLMAKIHNNPKLEEPRMPVILNEGEEDQWLSPITNKAELEAIVKLIRPFPPEQLLAHTVRPIRGKSGSGNTPEASEVFVYYDLLVKL